MTISSFLELAILGSVGAFLIQWLKHKFGTNSIKTKVLAITICIIIAGGYWLLRELAMPVLLAMFEVLSIATIVWAYFIKK